MKRTLLLLLIMVTTGIYAQQPEANYDEARVPKYTLPDLLTCEDGTTVTTVRQWERRRRPELMRIMADGEYGRTPKAKVKVRYEVVAENRQALNGKATQQQVLFTFSGQGREVKALALVYIPNHLSGPQQKQRSRVPVFIGYNFPGNHAITDDPAVRFSPFFERLNVDDALLQRARGMSRWPLSMIIERGYAVVTMCYNDIFPDNADGARQSVLTLFPENTDGDARWQALGAWAWGSSRIADWVCRQRWADAHKLAIIGHSRQGKAALWAGAQDTRFEVVISNESGCGGAALSKREFGERVGRITSSFPHWFCPAFTRYSGREQELPFDQHQLLALIAPRHLYVASAEGDQWSDPRGEYLAAYYASPVYALYGLRGLPSPSMPAIHQPIHNDIAYHIRAGRHDVTDYDWLQYMDYCDSVFGYGSHAGK